MKIIGKEVTVPSFFMDQTVVTNEEFDNYVKAMNVKTEPETKGRSVVFHKVVPPKLLVDVSQTVRVRSFSYLLRCKKLFHLSIYNFNRGNLGGCLLKVQVGRNLLVKELILLKKKSILLFM